jgi:hypothetical protein
VRNKQARDLGLSYERELGSSYKQARDLGLSYGRELGSGNTHARDVGSSHERDSGLSNAQAEWAFKAIHMRVHWARALAELDSEAEAIRTGGSGLRVSECVARHHHG